MCAKRQHERPTCARLSSDMWAVCGGGECSDAELRRDVDGSWWAAASPAAGARRARRTAPTVLFRLRAWRSAGLLPHGAVLCSTQGCPLEGHAKP